MNDGHKIMMYGCETCVGTDDLHVAMKAFRRKLIQKSFTKLQEMTTGRVKTRFQRGLIEYKDSVNQ